LAYSDTHRQGFSGRSLIRSGFTGFTSECFAIAFNKARRCFIPVFIFVIDFFVLVRDIASVIATIHFHFNSLVASGVWIELSAVESTL